MAKKISGKVIKGEGYGRRLGFPTANIERRSFSQLKIKPKLGVWGGLVKIKNQKSKIKNYSAAIVIGPKDKKGLPKIEAHLINFKGNLYGGKIIISLQKYIRPFRKFKNAEDLKKQIKKDVECINYKNESI